MDFMLEEEMIDLLTFCLQNPSSDELELKKSRFKEIGKETQNLTIDQITKILTKQKVMFTNMDYILSVRKQDARMYMTVGQEGQRHL